MSRACWVVLLVAGCAVLALGGFGISLWTSNADLRDQADRLEDSLIESERQVAQLRAGLAEAERELSRSEAALRDAVRRGKEAERLAGDLAGVIATLSSDNTEIGRLIRDIAGEIDAILDGLPDVPQ